MGDENDSKEIEASEPKLDKGEKPKKITRGRIAEAALAETATEAEVDLPPGEATAADEEATEAPLKHQLAAPQQSALPSGAGKDKEHSARHPLLFQRRAPKGRR